MLRRNWIISVLQTLVNIQECISNNNFICQQTSISNSAEMGKFWVLQNKGLSNVIIVIFSYVQMWAPGLHLMCCVCQQQLGLHHSILSKHWLNHNAITQWSLDHKAITQLLNHKSVIDSIPHRPVINVRGSPQIASQWILDPCLLHPGLLAGISQAKSIPQSSSWWYWCRCCLNSTLLRICCVLTDLTNFGCPKQFLSI